VCKDYPSIKIVNLDTFEIYPAIPNKVEIENEIDIDDYPGLSEKLSGLSYEEYHLKNETVLVVCAKFVFEINKFRSWKILPVEKLLVGWGFVLNTGSLLHLKIQPGGICAEILDLKTDSWSVSGVQVGVVRKLLSRGESVNDKIKIPIYQDKHQIARSWGFSGAWSPWSLHGENKTYLDLSAGYEGDHLQYRYLLDFDYRYFHADNQSVLVVGQGLRFYHYYRGNKRIKDVGPYLGEEAGADFSRKVLAARRSLRKKVDPYKKMSPRSMAFLVKGGNIEDFKKKLKLIKKEFCIRRIYIYQDPLGRRNKLFVFVEHRKAITYGAPDFGSEKVFGILKEQLFENYFKLQLVLEEKELGPEWRYI
jgi:hypothetical protein